MSSSEESAVTSKVQELMNALDQARKYRALSRLLVDFAIIMLVSIALLLSLELTVNYYRLANEFPCYFSASGLFTCTASLAGTSTPPFLLLVAGLSLLIIPAAGLLTGIFWVDHRLKSFKGGAWRDSLKEGFPGALKLLQELMWDSVIEDIRLSKLGYAVYFAIKVVGYWILAFIVLFFPYGFGLSLLHVEPTNLTPLAIISLVLVLVRSGNDLQRRYNQVVSLDTLMWELRWFSSEFRSAKFEA